MPTGKLQNHMARCCNRFANLTDYIDHDQYFGRLKELWNIRSNAVPIPVTSFQCNEWAVCMVHCTGSTTWSKHNPPSNDLLLLWMGTSPDRHCIKTAGHILARLKCHFVIHHAKASIKGRLALVQMFAAGPIRQTAGITNVEERDQPLTQTLVQWMDATIVSLFSVSEPLISLL